MGMVKKGCTRLVFLVGIYAIKVPNFTYSWQHFIKGILANIEESKIHSLTLVEGCEMSLHRHLICPVLWQSWGSMIIVMPRCERELSDDEYFSLDLTGYKTISNGDDKPENFMWLKGKAVRVDYG